jgi:hypothetical protein
LIPGAAGPAGKGFRRITLSRAVPRAANEQIILCTTAQQHPGRKETTVKGFIPFCLLVFVSSAASARKAVDEHKVFELLAPLVGFETPAAKLDDSTVLLSPYFIANVYQALSAPTRIFALSGTSIYFLSGVHPVTSVIPLFSKAGLSNISSIASCVP